MTPRTRAAPRLEGWVFQWRATGAAAWNSVVELEDDVSGGSHDLDGLENDTEYEVRVAAFHNTAMNGPCERYGDLRP